MKFTSLIFKNIWRNKIRTSLTILGISIGIATIVVFGLMTSGMEELFGGVLKPGKIDFTVVKAGSADIVLSFLGKDKIENIKNIDGVKEVSPFVLSFAPMGGNPYFTVGGLDREKLDINGITLIEGEAYSNDNEAIIGKITKKNSGFKIGDEMELNQTKYKITGIFESGVSFQDSGALTTISSSQKIQGITDQVNMVGVVVKDGYNIREVADKLEESDSEIVSVIDIDDFDAIDQGVKISNAISWAISLLAVVIGAIGVMNTIIMSVFERTKEIGVLRAVGWKKSRVVKMILAESFFVGVIASIVGILIGLGLNALILSTEVGEAWLKVNYDPIIFIRAFLVSVGVVLFGSIYPAYRASKMLPTEALRYE